MKIHLSLLFGATLFLGSLGQAMADVLKKPPQVPERLRFVRSLDIEGFAQDSNDNHSGVQTFRVRLRNLDPDVNAYVGLLTGVTHFNDEALFDPVVGQSGKVLWNWGGDIGLKRGPHLWEIDMMGSVFATHIGPALAFVGEHQLTSWLQLFHRTEGNFFVGTTVAEQDQGLTFQWNGFGVEAGYRFLAGTHFHRTGPHIGLTWRFSSEKIPFVFPSLG